MVNNIYKFEFLVYQDNNEYLSLNLGNMDNQQLLEQQV